MSGTSVNLGYPLWVDGMIFNSTIGRTIGTSAFYTGTSSAPIPGVINNHNNAFVVNATGGMGLSVGVGDALIGNAGSSLNGPYLLSNLSTASLTVPTADPTNPRIDLIVADVYDFGNSTSFCAIELITGTPAPSPSAPTPSAGTSYIPLYQVAVAAGTSSISSGNLTDVRVYTATAGGALMYPRGASAAVGNGGHPGRIGYDKQNDRFFHDNGVSSSIPAAQIKLRPWPAQKSYSAGNTTLTTGGVTLTTVNITTDGATDIDITGSFTVQCPAGTGGYSYLSVQLDSTELFRHYNTGYGNSTSPTSTVVRWTTGSESSDTPSAGTHTVKIVGVAPIVGPIHHAVGPWKMVVTPVGA